tara:strand:+ start:668 stop:1510 length:843 start_codon:yes stop_codon:yes gene_type:complete
MNILVSGGSGFIGKSFIKEALKNKANKIYAISRKKRIKTNPRLTWIKTQLDKNNKKYFNKINVLVHLAAAGIKKNVKKSDDVYDVNIHKSLKLINNLIISGCKNFVIISTSSEYGDKKKNLKYINKKIKRNPDTDYSISKAIFTDIVEKIAVKNKCKFRILRLFPVYGRGENSNRLYPSLIAAAKKGKNFALKNPFELRDFTNVRFVSKIILEACNFKKRDKKFEIYHVSSNHKMTVYEFAKKIWKKYKASGKLIKKNIKKKYVTHVSDQKSIWKLKKKY